MNRMLRAALAIVLAAVLIYSLASLALTKGEYEKAEEIYEKSRVESFHISDAVPVLPSPDAAEEAEEYFPDAEADFVSLKAVNPEVIGWLWIPDTEINFPLLKAEDNLKYLSLSYDLQWTNSGGIFIDYRNSPDFSDGNTVIYGHNMKNGGMFGTLKAFADASFLTEHAELYIFTETETLKYRVFTAYKTAADSLSYTRSFSEGTGFDDFIDYAESCAGGNFTDPPDSGRLVTLSTCTSGARSERFVVHAYFVASKPAEDKSSTENA